MIKYLNMKKIVGVVFICVLAILAVTSVGRTNYKTYYSGDAVDYKGNLIVASTDSGSLEVFKLNGSSLDRVSKFKAPNSPLDKTNDFSSVKLNIEDGRLFAYATSAYTLYKYDLSNLNRPVIFSKQKNSYYEWYKRVDKFGPYMATISDKSVKLWKIDPNTLDVIDSFKIENDLAGSVRFDASGRYITSINKDNQVRVFDVKTRAVLATFPVNYREGQSLRKSYIDPVSKDIYVFDDYFLKRFDLSGRLIVSYPNSSNNGYSVEPSGNYNYIYATNGDSIMKLSREDLKEGLKISASKLNTNGYAIDIKYVNINNSDHLVVFNGGGIAVLNSSLKKIASVQASEISDLMESKEVLVLALDHYLANPGAAVVLSGAGYFPNEDLLINFGGSITKLKADRNGRFSQAIVVPDANGSTIDAKVDGLTSRLTYSISFTVVKIK